MVDVIIDGGFGEVHPGTVVDCTGSEPLIVREGMGDINLIA